MRWQYGVKHTQAWAIGIIGTGLLVTVNLVILSQSFTLNQFLDFYNPWYTSLSLLLVFLVSLLGGAVAAKIFLEGPQPKYLSTLLITLIFVIFSADCPRCSSFLAQLSGQGAAAFAIFPLLGLEVKLVALFLLVITLFWQPRNFALPAIIAFTLLIMIGYLPEIAGNESQLSILRNADLAPASCAFE